MSGGRNRRNHPAKELAAAFVALLTSLTLSPEQAAADEIPGTAYAGPQFYFSAETDPVTVSFWAPEALRNGTQPAGKPVARFEIPRAYIFHAGGYSQTRHERLPAAIDVSRLGLILTWPDGMPYGVAVTRQKWFDDPEKRVPTEALREMRYIALIDQAEDPAVRSRPDASHARIGWKYGLDHYRTPDGGEYFFGGAGEDFLQAACVKDSGERTFCKYYIALGGSTVAIVSFLDFRYHGEREYLDERVRVFRAALCPYFECSVAQPPGE